MSDVLDAVENTVQEIIDTVTNLVRGGLAKMGILTPGAYIATGESVVPGWNDPLQPLDVGCKPLASGWWPSGTSGDAGRFAYQDILAGWQQKARAAYQKFVDADPYFFYKLANAWGDRYGLPRGLMGAILRHESGGKPWAYNPGANRESSAIGLGQVVYTTARGLGAYHSFQVSASLDAQAMLLSRLLKKTGGDMNKALASYAGKPITETTLDEFVAKYSGTKEYFYA